MNPQDTPEMGPQDAESVPTLTEVIAEPALQRAPEGDADAAAATGSALTIPPELLERLDSLLEGVVQEVVEAHAREIAEEARAAFVTVLRRELGLHAGARMAQVRR